MGQNGALKVFIVLPFLLFGKQLQLILIFITAPGVLDILPKKTKKSLK